MKSGAYRDGKIPGRRGYGIDDAELVRLFNSGLKIREIADKLGISQWTVLAHLKKLGMRRTRRHVIGKQDAFAHMTADACYWGGFLAADGFVLSGRNGVGVELAANDVCHLYCLCAFVGRDNALSYRTKHKGDKSFQYAEVDLISSKVLDDLAENFNIVPRKSLILEPPDLPKELRRHFIRGYFDGDGCVGWHKRQNQVRLNFCSGSERFLEWILNTIREELGDPGERKIGRRRNSKVRTLDLSGNAAIKVLEWMYADGGDALCLKRKHERFLKYKVRTEAGRAARADKRQTTVDEMVGLYAQGLSYGEIAEQLGTTKERVSHYLGKTDIPKRARRTDSLAGRKLGKRDQEMLAIHLAGERVDDIAVRFGMAKSSAWIAIQRAKGVANGLKRT